MKEKENTKLTTEEEEFCELYVRGGPNYAGKHSKCYAAAYKTGEGGCKSQARQELAKPHVKARLREMMRGDEYEEEVAAVKLQVAETLKAVMAETSNSSYMDRFGMDLSPAPLRAVSVNAAKALMELYPIKAAQESRLKIEGADGGVIFNVIVPNTESKKDEEN